MSSAGTAGPGQLGLTLPQPGDMYNRMLQIQEIRAAANNNALFQQTFQAKQLAGQIMAQAPDVATGLKNLQADPRTAAFAPELMSQYRQIELTNQQIAGEQQKQYSSGFHDLAAALPSAYIPANTDLGTFRSTMLARMGSMPDSVRSYLVDNGVVDNLQHALFDNLPKDPALAQQAYTQRMNALMLGADFSPDKIQQLIGTPAQIDAGDRSFLGQRSPYGGFTPLQTVGKGLAPQVSNVGGVPYVMGGGGNQGTITPYNPAAGAPAGTSPNALGASLASPSPAAASALPRPPGVSYGDPSRNPTGFPLLNPAQQKESDELSESFGGAEKKSFDNAQATLGSLDVMDNDLDQLASGPSSWLRPGFAGKARTTLANLANTVAGLTGNQPMVPPEKLAAAESFIKSTRQMGIQVLTTMLGNQREAAQTISNITEAVPSIDNTFLGGKLLVSLIRQQSQRAIDQRQFEQQYLAQNGTLIGATEAFNQSRPPGTYMAKAFDQLGMTPSGTFKNPQSVLNLARQGYLNHDQAVQILNRQFPGGPGKHLGTQGTPAPANEQNELGVIP